MSLKKPLLLSFLALLAVALAILIPVLGWLSPVAYMLLLPAGAIWIWIQAGSSVWDLGLRFKPGWIRRLAVGLGLGLLIPLLFQVSEWAGGWARFSPADAMAQGLLSAMVVPLVKMILIVAVEELVFRGFFLQALSPRVGFLAAAAVSSLLWGVGHLASMVQEGLDFGAILLGLITFLLWGLTLCLSFVRAGRSLWLPYGLHLGTNLGFSLVGLFFSVQPLASAVWLGHPAWSPESGWLGVVVWLVLALAAAGLTGGRRMKANLPGKNLSGAESGD